MLEECLTERKQARRRSGAPIVIVVLLALGLGFLGTRWVLRRSARASTWEAAAQSLAAEPGLVLLSSQRGSLRGLRDPDARDPLEILREGGVDTAAVELSFEPYTSLEPAFVLARARRALAPPGTVHLELDAARLIARGRASGGWVRRARNMAPALSGIDELDESELVDVDLEGAGAGLPAHRAHRAVLRAGVERAARDPGPAHRARGGSGRARVVGRSRWGSRTRLGARRSRRGSRGTSLCREPWRPCASSRRAAPESWTCGVGGTDRRDSKASLQVVRSDAQPQGQNR